MAKYKAALVILWLLIQGFMLWRYGVRVMGDSEGYIAYAQSIADSFHFPDNYQKKYFGYPLFMAGLFKLGMGMYGVILAQTLISGVAAAAVYSTARRLAGNLLAPVLATVLFICWYDMQQYNGFILTESLYISLFVFAFYFLAKADRNILKSCWALPFILFCCIVRPNGFIALVGYLGYLFIIVYTSIPSKPKRMALLASAVVVPLAAVLVVDQYLLTSFTIVETYEKGHLIFMYPELQVNSAQPIVMPPADASPLEKILYFAWHNTSYFLRMSGLRFLLFWGNVKPYFSVWHNLAIVLVLYPLYFFTGKAMLHKSMPKPLAVFALLVLLQQCFITTITSEDWNGRFLMSLIAFVFILGAVGLSWRLQKWQAKYKPTLTPQRRGAL